jgi:putative transposase
VKIWQNQRNYIDCRWQFIFLSGNKNTTCKKSTDLRPQECCARVVAALERSLTIPIQGKLTQTTILKTLVGMAAMNQSVHSATRLLENAPCETSLRHHLKKLDMGELEEKNTEILADTVHQVLKPGKAYQFAIDYTNDPYYGKTTDENESYVLKSKRKQSTNKFYSYATLYVTTRNRQFTLAVYPIQQGVSKVEYIARCLDQISALGLKIKVLCLDREFYTYDVFSFLIQNQIPFIIPVKKQSEQMKELLKGTQSRYAEYQMDGEQPLNLTIAVAVKYPKGKRGKHCAENLGYVVGGIDWHPHRVCDCYKSRFSIESSYRMRNLVKPKTSTKDPVIRYLYAIISFLLKNVWLILLWIYFSPVKPGPRTITMCAFRFDAFRLMIWSGIQRVLGMVKGIAVLREPG